MTILLYLLSLLLAQQPGQPSVGTISGQLRDIKGAPASGIRIFATSVEADVATTGDSVLLSNISQTDNEGRYRLQNVPPGRYLIVAGLLDAPSYYPGGTTPNRARIVTVAAGQSITNLDFRLDPTSGRPQEVWGRIGFDDGSPIPVGMLPRIRLILSSERAHWVEQPYTNQQGILTFQSVAPGEYAVTPAPLPLGFYVKSMTFGNVDLTQAPLVLTGVWNNTQIRVVLTKTRPAGTPPGVRVSGRVTNRTSLLELIGIVSVIDRDHPETVINTVASVTPGEDGSFEIEGVLPGNYTLGARDSKGILTFQVAGNDVTNLELNPLTTGPFARFLDSVRSGFPVALNPSSITGLPVSLNPSSIRSITGTVEGENGTIPEFEIGFTTTRTGAANHAVTVSSKDFSVPLPEGEYRVSISGLPNGYAVKSVTAGPLDLTEPFLVTIKGIADRFTGGPILIQPAGQSAAISAGITVRLTPPLSGK